MSDIGSKLGALRKAKGMSMEALALEAEVSRMTVQRIEAGADMRLFTLQEILRVLGAEVMLVPTALRADIEALIRSQGLLLTPEVNVRRTATVVALHSRGRHAL